VEKTSKSEERKSNDELTNVVIVGGSIVGLCTALALAGQGVHVTVLERSNNRTLEVGGGLGVEVDLLQSVTGLRSKPPVCRGSDRDTTAWQLLRDWLEDGIDGVPLIDLRHDVNVSDVVANDGEAVVTSSKATKWRADVVIGADGVHSTVRRFVAPDNPSAVYAGFVLWRAMVPEELLKDMTALPGKREPSREFYADHYRLVTYPVPGADGDDRVGHRRLNLVWYDPSREKLLKARGLLDGEVVRGSLLSDALPTKVNSELRRIARQTWPSPWSEALNIALEEQLIFGTPVAEYMPERLVLGRVAIAGDAAHAASPMVGGGFIEGLFDAAQLAESAASTSSAEAMLDSYESARLKDARRHVAISQRASRSYLSRHGQ
jgi:2-polyprenyl-6-methoxyphenol hydroxylase-like FAD-dependent oxidoreductase